MPPTSIRICSVRSPCAPDCPRRAAECHGQCAEYQRYAEARRREYDRRMESKRRCWDCDRYTPEHLAKYKRLQRQRGKMR